MNRGQLGPTPVWPTLVVIIVATVTVLVGAQVYEQLEGEWQPENLCDSALGEEWDPVDPDAESNEVRCQAPNGSVEDPWDHIEIRQAA